MYTISIMNYHLYGYYIICKTLVITRLPTIIITRQFSFTKGPNTLQWTVASHSMFHLSPVSFFRISLTSLIGAPNIMSSARIC